MSKPPAAEETNCSMVLIFMYTHLVMLAVNVVIFVCINVNVMNVLIKNKNEKCVYSANQSA